MLTYLRFDDLFAILVLAVVMNMFGHFLHREMFGVPMNVFPAICRAALERSGLYSVQVRKTAGVQALVFRYPGDTRPAPCEPSAAFPRHRDKARFRLIRKRAPFGFRWVEQFRVDAAPSLRPEPAERYDTNSLGHSQRRMRARRTGPIPPGAPASLDRRKPVSARHHLISNELDADDLFPRLRPRAGAAAAQSSDNLQKLLDSDAPAGRCGATG
jgi:hypothetical protein